jgi:hypothetical protein
MSLRFPRPLAALPLAAALLAGAVGLAQAQVSTPAPTPKVTNPYSPRYGHEYRHGALPTVEALNQMNSWTQSKTKRAATTSNTLFYNGGNDGIGVTSGPPKVYLVLFGAQWGNASYDAAGNLVLSQDPVGAVPYLQRMFKGIGTGNETWSGTMTQYCDGPLVGFHATSCGPGTQHVGYASGGAFAGIFYDNAVLSPQRATGAQLADEALKAAQYFGNTSPTSNRYAQYVVLSPPGAQPDGFALDSDFCGWHDYSVSPVGDLAFTNLPYVVDRGNSCGAGWVNTGQQGYLDGFSIVAGHEYAETITDQNPSGGWINSEGEENADECQWLISGHGAIQAVQLGNGSYPMQATWSNDTNNCELSHAIVGGTVVPPPSAKPDISAAANPVIVPYGATTAAATVTWTAVSNDSSWRTDVAYKLNGASIVRWKSDQPAGSASLSLHAGDSVIFYAYQHHHDESYSNQVTVTAVAGGSPLITAPSVVTIPYGKSIGTYPLTWDTPGYLSVDVYGDNSLTGTQHQFLGTAPSPGSAQEPVSVGEIANVAFYSHDVPTLMLGAVTIQGVQGPAPTLTATPESVIVPYGRSSANYFVTWNTPGYDTLDVYGDNSLTGAHMQFLGTTASPGSAYEPVSPGETARMSFFPHGDPNTYLGSVTVQGIQGAMPAFGASPNVVVVPNGANTGTYALSWNAPGYDQLDVYGDNSLTGAQHQFLGTAAAPGSASEPISVGETATIYFYPHGDSSTLLGTVSITAHH